MCRDAVEFLRRAMREVGHLGTVNDGHYKRVITMIYKL